MLDKETLLSAHDHRHLKFEGACNVRDLGGLPTADGRVTRHGVVYRSDTLAHLSATDLERLAQLDLRTVIDLRSADECARAPDRLPAAVGLAMHNPGFMPKGNHELIGSINAGKLDAAEAVAAMLGQYRNLTLEHLAEYRVFVSALLAPGHTPLLFHCASGKDRTGIAAAIVLLAVGVPQSWVVQDYVISNYQRRAVDLFTDDASSPAVEQVMSAHPVYLEAAITAMTEAFGSVDAYLAQGLGIDRAARCHLETLLLEPVSKFTQQF
jgi:protein-tyrosine phosphatase